MQPGIEFQSPELLANTLTMKNSSISNNSIKYTV